MKKTTLLLVALLPLIIVIAQKKNKTLEKAGKSITAADLKRHLYVVASADNEGRDTPSAGLEKAGDYIESTFKAIGLKPGNGDSYRQYYPLYKDSVISSSLSVNGRSFEVTKDYANNNANYSADLPFSEVVFAGYGIVDDKIDSYKDLDIRGKAVMIVEGAPADYKSPQPGGMSPSQTFGKLQNAAKKGAVAVLLISKSFGSSNRPANTRGGGWTLNGYKPSFSPLLFYISENVAAAIMGEDGNGIFDKTAANNIKYKTYKASVDLSFKKTLLVNKVSNVLGLLEGTDKKDEYVIITAHYDHVGKRDSL